MRRKRGWAHNLFVSCVVTVTLVGFPVYGGDAISEGMTLPPFEMSMPDSAAFKQYLGVDDLKAFSASSISGKLLFIEAFSTFCPVCHRNAPVLNNLYQIIEGDPELSKDVKILAIAAGNKYHQIDSYRAQVKAPFPIVEDPYLKFYKGIGSPGVPFMILASNDGKVLMTHGGMIESLDEILGKIREFQKR